MMAMLSQSALTQGHDGPVTVNAVVNGQGRVAYLTVDAAGETEGKKVMDSAWLAQFLGKTLPLTLGKDVDAATGATATSQAVVDALNILSPDYDNASAAPVIDQRSVTKAVAHIQQVQGHDSQMKVIVYLNPEGKVTQVKVFAEGESNGQAVMDDAFTGQFVGADSEITLGEDVDAVTGATQTSQAVVDAVNKIIK